MKTSTWRLLTPLLLPAATMAAAPVAGNAAEPSQEAPPQAAQRDPGSPSPADASSDSAAEPTRMDEIVVTGTLIRGMDKPVGTNVISVGGAEITASGASSANELMRNIPQVTSAFLDNPTIDGGGVSVIRPNLRSLGGSGGATTLILLDGHRMVPAGIKQTTPDPDVIPPAVLERVEIVPDGGSSIYGSDAVGGVINFVTRKSFDGFEASGRYGFADNYRKLDVNLTGGKAWDSGSGYVSYAFSRNDALLGRDRDFMRQVDIQRGFCAPGTVVLPTGESYAIENGAPGATAGTLSTCDNTDNVSFWPGAERTTFFAGLNQTLTSILSFDLRAYHSRRQLEQFGASPGGDQTWSVTDSNPYFQPVGDETSHTVLSEFAGVFSNAAPNALDEYGITPTLTADFGDGWQLRLLGNFGASSLQTRAIALDPAAVSAALAATTTATALNPYDPGASNPTVLAGIVRNSFSDAEQKLNNGRALVDGPLFDLPGGALRVAAGAEYIQETYRGRTDNVVFGQEQLAPLISLERNVVAVFGEVAVPIVGAGNAMPGIQELTLSASGRHDDYSDVGSTFNPKLGLTWKPVEGFNVRGNWGESFNAPSLVDKNADQAQGWVPAPFVPGQTAPWSVVFAGNDGTNKPQTAETWSFGVDVQPASVPGLMASLTYYNLRIDDLFGIVLPTLGFSDATAPYLQDNLTCAEVLAVTDGIRQFPGLPAVTTACLVNPDARFAYVDLRLRNLGALKQDGVDFNLAYNRFVGFGTMDASLSGTYTLSREVALVAGTPFEDRFDNPGTSRYFLAATLGLQVGDFFTSASIKHRAGYDLGTPTAPVVAPGTPTPFPPQTEVDAFTTVDAFLSYDASKWLGNTVLTVNLDNAFDEEPPFYNSCSSSRFPCGYTNGSTLGRTFTVGVRTSF